MQVLLLLIVLSALDFVSLNGLINDGPVELLTSNEGQKHECVCVCVCPRKSTPAYSAYLFPTSNTLIARPWRACFLELWDQKLKIENSERTLRELVLWFFFISSHSMLQYPCLLIHLYFDLRYLILDLVSMDCLSVLSVGCRAKTVPYCWRC